MACLSNDAELRAFLVRFMEAVRDRDSSRLSEGFVAPKGATEIVNTKFLGSISIESACASIAVGSCEPYANILALRLQSRVAAAEPNPQPLRAYELEKELASKFLQIFTGEDNWLCPSLYAIVRNLRVAATRADATAIAARPSGENRDKRTRVEPTKCLNDCVQLLLSAFRQTVSDRAPLEVSKKVATIYVAVNLFKVYFRVNKASKCTEVYQAVAKLPRFPKIESFPLAHSVAYQYYVGRLHMLEGSNELAERELSFALQHCDKSHRVNIRKILACLIPVRMLRGTMPSLSLLKKFGLLEFTDIVKGVRTGDVRLFRNALSRHQSIFIEQGTFLVLEKLRNLTYRNCLKRLWFINGSGKRLDTREIVRIFSWLDIFNEGYISTKIDEEEQLDDVECILANLIHSGFVKGYIAHNHRKLVLSGKNAFPSVKQVLQK